MPHRETLPAPGGVYPLGERTVARGGFGAMQLRRLASDPGAALAVLERAIELGVDHIDTAQFYGDGFVNGLVRQVLRPGRGVVVATKVGADADPQAKIRSASLNAPNSCAPAWTTTSPAWASSTSPWCTCAAPT